ncbi:sulfite exporter TauE/SafE family protein [Priestia megaterium]
MDLTFIITLFLIGFIGSFISGMVGIGGSVINYPMLLYIPPLVGVGALTAHQVSGAGGAFILVPVMLVVLKIPTRMTIATSLAVTFISSIGSTIGKLVTHQVPFTPAVILVAASLIASPIGAKVGQKMNTKVLQWILAGLILATAIKIW